MSGAVDGGPDRGPWDAIVCGAGVAGLATARALDLAGLRVLLLEKQRVPVPIAKGEVLQPSSVRILREWGVMPLLLRRGAVPLGQLMIRDADGRRLMLFDYRTMPGEDRRLFSLDYPEILAALRESLGEQVECWSGALVEGLVRDGGGRVSGVRVVRQGREWELTAPLVVAADGRSSKLRRDAGIGTTSAEYGHRLLSFDIDGVPAAAPEVTTYLTGEGLRLAYPLPGARMRLYAQVRPDALRGTGPERQARLEDWCRELLAGTPALRPLEERLRASFGSRQLLNLWRFTADVLAVPGLALVGEAAHCVHPMAAQGMNTAIADAEALAACLTGRGFAARASTATATVDRALEAYAAQRVDWVRHMDRMSHDATRMITQLSRPGQALGRRVLRRMDGNPRLRYQATYNMAGLGIRPFTALDRLHQLGLPDPRARRVPDWA
ncbi:FAD-dependent oxidoreductase [Kitasatospora purpeofusca]|uniref:FAD-dependent oxidoreductase n=1 Tax=Kitasatospora purpeofusca TaxID=67352 RepID=UPI00225BCA23|nr:NAD(P)/FAD-dependent oxidoreductase [Kitasatospora purpeofusca]MCX4755416.1 FAD-dependent monooxygenase [Kitasatospora purpeofusca]WSR36713.1 FAD-dependent monooxygenase [Kitasatospora purpeofusca]WSR44995.1 FAD-dependent monooxygenase [Kitasatospora purpeofusca]